ncbi:MAG: class I SAM-dependent methyltransferase [Vicinamibacterales bacterium]
MNRNGPEDRRSSAREREVAELYGELHAHAADDFWRTCLLPGFRRHLEALGLDPDHALRGCSFLDAGCGGFAGGAAMALALGAATVVGVDLSEANVAEARRRFSNRPGVRFVEENLLALSFPSASFDFVYCTGVLHHTADPHRAFLELVRVLRPGGRLYVGIYGRGGLYNEALLPALKLAGRIVPRSAAALVTRLAPSLSRPSSSLLDAMYAPIEVHYRRNEVENWFDGTGIRPVFLRHPRQPASFVNRALYGDGTMLFFSGVKEA